MKKNGRGDKALTRKIRTVKFVVKVFKKISNNFSKVISLINYHYIKTYRRK